MVEQVFVYICKTCAYDVMSDHELREMGSNPCANCKSDNSNYKEKSPSALQCQTDYVKKSLIVSIPHCTAPEKLAR